MNRIIPEGDAGHLIEFFAKINRFRELRLRQQSQEVLS